MVNRSMLLPPMTAVSQGKAKSATNIEEYVLPAVVTKLSERRRI